MTLALIHHLLTIFTHNPRIHRALISFYARQQPGMPRAWYATYIQDLIRDYPQAMRACIASFHGTHATAQSYHVCP